MSGIYRALVKTFDPLVPTKLRPIWDSPAGPKTIFFWAPAVKWVIVCAGISDLKRPVEKISLGQTLSLAATGVIWTRYSMVIKPKNYVLMSVNVFIAATNLAQLGRIVKARM